VRDPQTLAAASAQVLPSGYEKHKTGSTSRCPVPRVIGHIYLNLLLYDIN
jgi:hypothetical protein